MGQNNGLKSCTNRRQLLSKPRQKNPRLSAAVGLKREKNHSLFLDHPDGGHADTAACEHQCRPRGEGDGWKRVETGL